MPPVLFLFAFCVRVWIAFALVVFLFALCVFHLFSLVRVCSCVGLFRLLFILSIGTLFTEISSEPQQARSPALAFYGRDGRKASTFVDFYVFLLGLGH